MTGGIVVQTNKQRGTTEESVGTIGGDSTLGFAPLASRATVEENKYVCEAQMDGSTTSNFGFFK